MTILKNSIRLIKQAKENGISLNAFCTKQKALKGALRSMFFKLWRKVFVVINTVTVRYCSIAGCVRIESNNATSSSARVLKADAIHTLTAVKTFSRIYGFKVAVL